MCPPWIRGRVGGLSTSQCSSLLTPGQNTPSSGRHMSPLPNVPCVTVIPAPCGRQSHPSGPSFGWTWSAWSRCTHIETCSPHGLAALLSSTHLPLRCPELLLLPSADLLKPWNTLSPLRVSSSPVAVLHGGFWSKTVTLAYCLLFFSSKILVGIYNFILVWSSLCEHLPDTGPLPSGGVSLGGCVLPGTSQSLESDSDPFPDTYSEHTELSTTLKKLAAAYWN